MMQTFTGPKEAWDEIFDIVTSYLNRPNISAMEKQVIANHLKSIQPVEASDDDTIILKKFATPPPPAVGKPLTFQQIQVGMLVQFLKNQKSVANCRARVEKKGRSKIVVVMLDDATNNWKAGTRLRTDASSLIEWTGGEP